MISDKLIKIITSILIVLWIFRIPVYVSKILTLNFGLPPLRYIQGIFVYIPTVALLISVLPKKIKMPYLALFIFFSLGFIFLESGFIGDDLYWQDFGFIINFLNIYWYFLILVNSGENEYFYHKILIFSYASIFSIMVVTYLGYLDIFNIASLYTLESFNVLQDRRFKSLLFHPNGVSLKMSLGICILFILKIKNIKIFNLKLNTFWLWLNIFLFLFIIVLNASRGAFAISAVFILFYLFYTWHGSNRLIKMFAVGILMLLTVFMDVPSTFNKFYIAKRITNEDFYNLQSFGRGREVLATWQTFLNNPWFGAGYQKAAGGLFRDITRSNFSYTQILASHGVFYFLIYIYFLKKLFVVNKKLFMKLIPTLLVVAGFAPLMFYNTYLCVPISLIAYLVYYEKKQINRK